MFNLAQCLTLAVTAAIRPGTEQDEEQSIAYVLANTVVGMNSKLNLLSYAKKKQSFLKLVFQCICIRSFHAHSV